MSSQHFTIKPEIELLSERGFMYPPKSFITFYSSPYGFLENFYVYFILRRAMLEKVKILALSVGEDIKKIIENRLFFHRLNTELFKHVRQEIVDVKTLEDINELTENLPNYAEEYKYIYVINNDMYDSLKHVSVLKKKILNIYHLKKEQLAIILFTDDSLLQKDEWRPIRFTSDVEYIVRAFESFNTGEIIISRVKLGVKPEYKINFSITKESINFQIQLVT